MIFFLNLAEQETVVPGNPGTSGQIISPMPGSFLDGSSATFIWRPGNLAIGYMLKVGTTPGGVDIYDGAELEPGVLQDTVTGLPLTGATIYVQLRTDIGTVGVPDWVAKNYVYTSFINRATVVTPLNGSTLASVTPLFTLQYGSATNFMLTVALDPIEQNNFLYNTGDLVVNEIVTTFAIPMPNNGEAVYVRLWSKVDGVWSYNLYTYTAFSDRGAYLIEPTSGTIIASAAQGFTWELPTDSTALQFRLQVGTSQGLGDISDFYQVAATRMAGVTGLPYTVGRPIWVRLSTETRTGVWVYTDYSFLTSAVQPVYVPPASTFAPAYIIDPVPGPYQLGDTQIFTWAQPYVTGSPRYNLAVGTGFPGASNIYNGTALTATYQSVTGISAAVIYVRLTTYDSGNPSLSLYYDYTYAGGGSTTKTVIPLGVGPPGGTDFDRYLDPYDLNLPWVATPPGGYAMVDGSGDFTVDRVIWTITFAKPYNFKPPVAPYTTTTVAVLWQCPVNAFTGVIEGPWTSLEGSSLCRWRYPTNVGVPSPDTTKFWMVLSQDRTELTLCKDFNFDSASPLLYCLELRGSALIDDQNQPHPGIAAQTWLFFIFDPNPNSEP